MNKITYLFLLLLVSNVSFAQNKEDAIEEKQKGHYNINKFKQLKEELGTSNTYRTASGAPGHEYYQQKVDYKMDIILDDENEKIYGEEVITYHNNSPDDLNYLWVQMDQNIRAADAITDDIDENRPSVVYKPKEFTRDFLKKSFDGGFKLDYVKDIEGNDLLHTVNGTMMRIDLPAILKSGEKTSFKIRWWYNLRDHTIHRDRSGFEHFEEDGNNVYVIAQFFPRLAVYNDVEGWQNSQFFGQGEFALEFGDYEVNITTPDDHVLEGTGYILNRKEMLNKKQWKLYEEALSSFEKPVIIVSQDDAENSEKGFSKKTKTWKLKAENVRDFAFASSRKFILDAQAVKIGDRTVMAISAYPKEGNPLWEEYSTKVVAHTLVSYSDQLFDYPYHKAISVHAKNQGMEYPMICWNHGRPKPDGTYSARIKNGMLSVIIHEIGHNWFPMIVNSDERQWGWMDEGLNTFAELIASEKFEGGIPASGYPKDMVGYMSGNQDRIAPIMTQHHKVFQSGYNAYYKPSAGLYILREVVLGHDLFDKAFKTYSERWKFKHPTPADFFRTMEDASGTDLDWFWRGWFYTTDYNDIGVKEVRKFIVSDTPTEATKEIFKRYGANIDNYMPALFLVNVDDEEQNNKVTNVENPINDIPILTEYIADNFDKNERESLKNAKYFYEVIFEKPGGLVMPIIVDYIYTDGTKESKYYPAEIWRFNDKEVKKFFASDKELKEINIDPNQLTADVDLENNTWPKKTEDSQFDNFKKNSVKN